VNEEVLAHWEDVAPKTNESGDQKLESEMGVACGTYGGRREIYSEFYGEI
jgi:hypothetical protein